MKKAWHAFHPSSTPRARLRSFVGLALVSLAGACDGSAPAPMDGALRAALRAGAPEAVLDIEVELALPRLAPAPLAPMVSTYESSAMGAPDSGRFTLDGRPVTADELARRAEADHALIAGAIASQAEGWRAAVAQAIGDAELGDQVIGRGDTGFRMRVPARAAEEVLERLGGRVAQARLTPVADVSANAMSFDLPGGALTQIGVLDFAHAYGHTGDGIGVWHMEGNSPYLNRPEFLDADVRLTTPEAHWQPAGAGAVCRFDDECCSGDCFAGLARTCTTPSSPRACGNVRTREHATMVAMLVHGTAPDATIYHSLPPWNASGGSPGCLIDMSMTQYATPPVYVGAQSWSVERLFDQNGIIIADAAYNDSYNVFDDCNRKWDDFIVASRIAHFHSAGNSNYTQVGNPARAYNVTAVGQYDPDTYDMLSAESTWYNPSTGVEKPEIVAPGMNIALDTNGWGATGSSIAAPIAAGFAADLMTTAPFFRNQPQAVRAYLIAGAHNVDSGAGLSVGNSDHDGAGRIDYLDTFFNRWGKVWAYGGNDAWFVDNRITESVYIEAGKHYTIAIAWLADGGYAHQQTAAGSSSTLNMRMKLNAAFGGYSWTAYQSKNNFQLLDIWAPLTGYYTITIERMFDANVGGVDLALTVGEHH